MQTTNATCELTNILIAYAAIPVFAQDGHTEPEVPDTPTQPTVAVPPDINVDGGAGGALAISKFIAD